jgi:hypothetical protein
MSEDCELSERKKKCRKSFFTWIKVSLQPARQLPLLALNPCMADIFRDLLFGSSPSNSL